MSFLRQDLFPLINISVLFSTSTHQNNLTGAWHISFPVFLNNEINLTSPDALGSFISSIFCSFDQEIEEGRLMVAYSLLVSISLSIPETNDGKGSVETSQNKDSRRKWV